MSLEYPVDRCSGQHSPILNRRTVHPAVYYGGDYCPACQCIEQAEEIETLRATLTETQDALDQARDERDRLRAMVGAVAREAGHVA